MILCNISYNLEVALSNLPFDNETVYAAVDIAGNQGIEIDEDSEGEIILSNLLPELRDFRYHRVNSGEIKVNMFNLDDYSNVCTFPSGEFYIHIEDDCIICGGQQYISGYVYNVDDNLPYIVIDNNDVKREVAC